MDGAIQAADDRLVYLSGDEDAIRAYEVRFKAECDWASEQAYSINTGEARGMKKGEAKGQTKKALEIAHKMKAIGRPSAEISEVTGLSLETVQGL
jgi:hypothetical protein